MDIFKARQLQRERTKNIRKKGLVVLSYSGFIEENNQSRFAYYLIYPVTESKTIKEFMAGERVLTFTDEFIFHLNNFQNKYQGDVVAGFIIQNGMLHYIEKIMVD